MIIKESCENCSSLSGCTKIIENNINNKRFLPSEKDWINCVNFEHLESIIEERIMYNINLPVDDDLNLTTDYTYKDFELPTITQPKLVKKIKVTAEFYNFLSNLFNPFGYNVETSNNGVVGQFSGIPVEIDDTLENTHFEFVYEEDKQ